MNSFIILFFILITLLPPVASTQSNEETFPPMKYGKIPLSVADLWRGYDPRKEPLETEILKEWEEDGVVMRIVRYRIGIFKGQKSMMAAVYGFPKGVENVPGLLQIHGGGQYADYRSVLMNAKRGYATISIAWAGRINAPDYKVNPDVVKLFWDGKTNDPNYKVTTDWGVLDAYHAPCRNEKNHFGNIDPAAWTLDALKSPRNNPWFLCTLGARRALTFLEQQPEVDAEKLGVYGHSMGGKITVLTTGTDARVKAAVPSCGGISDRYNKNELYENTIGDDQYLKRVSCPMMFLSPANDFHGRIYDLQLSVKEIKNEDWRVTCSAHHNHQDDPEFMVTGLLWMDQFLKKSFSFPSTPIGSLNLKTKNGEPSFSVRADMPLKSVDVFYTQQGIDGNSTMEESINRFWHFAEAKEKDGVWLAQIPVFSMEKPVWAYANVLYDLQHPVDGAGYYYQNYSTKAFNISTLVQMASPEDLKKSGAKATLKPSMMIEDFKGEWQKEWFSYNKKVWDIKTHKLYDELWEAPEKAQISIEIKSAQANKMVISLDDYAVEVSVGGNSSWEKYTFSASDFKDASGEILPDWSGIKELRLGAEETIRKNTGGKNDSKKLGAKWEGSTPKFRNLKWEQK